MNHSGYEAFTQLETHLLNDEKPSQYLEQISEQSFFEEFPFEMLLRQKTTKQSPEHHPEGNVWKHTLLVTDEAAKRKEKSSDTRKFMWAALLHDIGKPDTTRNRRDKITSYDHDKVGSELAKRFLSVFSDDKDFINSVAALVRWHMQILFVVKGSRYADIETMKAEVNVNDVALLGLCDRLGRGKADIKKEEQNIELFLSEVNSI